jgi:hypothetical protein
MNRFKYLIYANKELTRIYNQLNFLLLIRDSIAHTRSFGHYGYANGQVDNPRA